jgi:hypothetical protein
MNMHESIALIRTIFALSPNRDEVNKVAWAMSVVYLTEPMSQQLVKEYFYARCMESVLYWYDLTSACFTTSWDAYEMGEHELHDWIKQVQEEGEACKDKAHEAKMKKLREKRKALREKLKL